MDNKILIAYATRCGSTGEIAKAMAEELCASGNAVDVILTKNVTDLSPYSTVIVGSAIRMGRWLPEAMRFVESRKNDLAKVNTFFFAVHGNNRDDSETSKQQRALYLDPVRSLVTPRSDTCFAGAITMARMGFVERMMTKALKATDADYRDWNAIRQWARSAAKIDHAT